MNYFEFIFIRNIKINSFIVRTNVAIDVACTLAYRHMVVYVHTMLHMIIMCH